jgi:hypothetical protein
VTKIGKLGTTLAATSNRRTVFLRSVCRLLVAACVVPSSPILVTLMKEVLGRFLQEPHGVTSQKTPFFIVIAVKTSNLNTTFKLDVIKLEDKKLASITAEDW